MKVEAEENNAADTMAAVMQKTIIQLFGKFRYLSHDAHIGCKLLRSSRAIQERLLDRSSASQQYRYLYLLANEKSIRKFKLLNIITHVINTRN